MRVFVLFLGLLVGCLEARAGWPGVSADSAGTKGQAPQGQATLTVLTSPDSALVAIDGVLRGLTPLVVDSLGAGRHLLRVTGRDTANWLEDPTIDTVELAPGDHRVLKYTLGVSYALGSVPSGATVLIGGIPAGVTPMVVRAAGGGPAQPVMLRKEGYEPAQVDLARASRGSLLVPLHRIWSADQVEEGESGVLPLQAKPGPARLYVSGLAAVAAGAVAAYFKIQADDLNDTYLQTGDPALRLRIHKYDTISALSLTAAQIGIGLFAYFLLTE